MGAAGTTTTGQSINLEHGPQRSATKLAKKRREPKTVQYRADAVQEPEGDPRYSRADFKIYLHLFEININNVHVICLCDIEKSITLN